MEATPLYCAVYARGELAYTVGTMTGGEPAFGRRVLANIEPATHAAKPEGQQGRISNVLIAQRPVLTTCDRLARAISEGRTVLPSVHAGKRSPDTWQAQQLFFVDVDNDAEALAKGYGVLTINEATTRAFGAGLPLLMVYESFRSGDPERYRLIFALDEPTRDKERAQGFVNALLGLYPEADPSSNQLNRMFYGTNKEVQLWITPLPV